MFITEQVAYIKANYSGGWTVRFATSPRFFQYNKARLLVLSDPEVIDLEEKGMYVNNKRIGDVAELLCFSTPQEKFYRVTHTNGFVESLDGRQVYVTRTPVDQIGGGVWDYLRKLADETGLCDEEGNNSLAKGYACVDVKRDNVPLAQYLGAKRKLAVRALPKVVYYPFGCNASQQAAVEAALCHQVSIVQGPPGTGKTQTILNIIANLLLADKTVLVVSNNNSAVVNVAEKLHREGLGFVVAQLGNAENKVAFVRSQSAHYPEMSDWALADEKPVRELARRALQTVSQGFEDQTMRAQLKAEYDALLREQQYNDLLGGEILSEDGRLTGLSGAQLMKLLMAYRLRVEQGKKVGTWVRLKWAFAFGFRLFSFLKGEATEVIAGLEKASIVCVRQR